MIGHVLVFAVRDSFRGKLTGMLQELGIARVTETAIPEEAEATMTQGVDAAFVSATDPIGVALRVIAAAAYLSPGSSVTVVSDRVPQDMSHFSRAGAQGHLLWPATPAQINACLEAEGRSLVALERSFDDEVRSLVGRIGVKDAQERVRYTMLRQALALANGSRCGAASLLGVTRPAVQRMLREDREADAASMCPSATHRDGRAPSGVVRISRLLKTRGIGVRYLRRVGAKRPSVFRRCASEDPSYGRSSSRGMRHASVSLLTRRASGPWAPERPLP